MFDSSRYKKFDQLYLAYNKMVRNVIYNMTGDAALQDLVQETFLRVWKGLPIFSSRSSEKTWVYRIAINASIDYLRKKKLVLVPLDQDLAGGVKEIFPQEELQKSLRLLDESLRSMVILFYFEGLELKEIAKILGVPVGTVKSRLHTAREKLRDILEERGVVW